MSDYSDESKKDLSSSEVQKYADQIRLGEFDNVLKSLNVVKANHPNFSLTYILMGFCYSIEMLESGDFEKPVSYFNKAKELGCKDVDYFSNIKDHYTRVGDYFYKSGKLEESYKYYLKSTEFSSHNNHLYISNLGSALHRLDRTDEAIKCYNEAIYIEKNYPLAHSNLGLIYYESKQYDDALDFFYKCTLIDPAQPYYWKNYSNCLWALKKHEEALKGFYKVIMLSPLDVNCYTQIGNALCFLGRFKEFQDLIDENFDDIKPKPHPNSLFIKSSKPSGNSVELTLSNGEIVTVKNVKNPIGNDFTFEVGGSKTSNLSLKNYLDKSDKNDIRKKILFASLLNLLGESYFHTGDFNASINYYNQAIELNLNNSSYHLNISNAYKELGDDINAKIYYEKYSKLSSVSKKND
jgi:tetratricopeptide (TPR) repeat protein